MFNNDILGYRYHELLHVSSYKINPLYVNAIVRGIKTTINPTNTPVILEADDGYDTTTLPHCIAQSRVFTVTVENIVNKLKHIETEGKPVSIANTGLPFTYCMVVPSKPLPLDDPLGNFKTVAYLLVEGDLDCLALSMDNATCSILTTAIVADPNLTNAIAYLVKLPQSTAVLTPGQRYAWKAATKSKALPTPYYTVDWTKVRKTPSSAPSVVEVSDEENTESNLHRFLKYRHDRSAHRRLHVRRLTGTLDACTHACLIKRGFVIYGPEDTLGPVSADHLVRRGHPPKQSGETVALRVSAIRQTIVGKPGLPYLPAVRTVSAAGVTCVRP